MIDLPVMQSWTAEAACVATDSEAFFPDGSGALEGARPAMRVCAGCPISAVIGCARAAIELNEDYTVTGVWAGQYLSTKKTGRDKALRELHAISGIPYRPERKPREWNRKCAACKRKMRPRDEAAKPGVETVRYGAKGMCDTCAVAKRKGVEVSAFLKVAS